MEADRRTLPTWVSEWDKQVGNENFGRAGGRLDGARHVDRVRTRDQRFEALVGPLRPEMPCPHCGRMMEAA